MLTEVFDIGVREGLEICLVIALMASLVRRPWSRDAWRGRERARTAWIAGAAAASLLVSIVVVQSGTEVSTLAMAGIETGASALAVACSAPPCCGPPAWVDARGSAASTAAISASLTVVLVMIEVRVLRDGWGRRGDGPVDHGLAGGGAVAVVATVLLFAGAVAVRPASAAPGGRGDDRVRGCRHGDVVGPLANEVLHPDGVQVASLELSQVERPPGAQPRAPDPGGVRRAGRR
ncbi:MAG: hypothetical protein QM784_19710 [Polyangiaceae bacterium]